MTTISRLDPELLKERQIVLIMEYNLDHCEVINRVRRILAKAFPDEVLVDNNYYRRNTPVCSRKSLGARGQYPKRVLVTFETKPRVLKSQMRGGWYASRTPNDPEWEEVV